MTSLLIKKLASIFCLILIAAPMAIVVLRYSGLYFLLYLIFWILIPGYLLLHILKNNGLECKTKGLSFVFAFFIGTALLFIEFFTLHFFGAIELIKYINPVLSIALSVVFYFDYKKNKVNLPSIKKQFLLIQINLPFILTWLVATYLCALTLNFFMPNMQSIIYEDFSWQIGNVNQHASAYPFEDIRVAGVDFKYHYFNTLFYSIEKILFDTSGWVIFIQHQIFIIPLLVTLSFYNLFSSLATNKWGIALFSIFAFTGFSFSKYYSNFMFNWSSNMNAVGLTTAASCALFFSIKPLLEDKIILNKKNCLHIGLSVILLLILSGLKGPYGAIFIAAFVCFILMQLLRRIKPTNVALIFIVIATPLFLLMYNNLLSSGASTYFSYDVFDGILASVSKITFFSDLPHLPGMRIIMFVPSLIFTFTLIFIPLVLCALDCILFVFRKKELRPDIIFASFLTVIGTAAFYFFDITGGVQVYFLFCSIPFAGYIALNKIIEIFNKYPKTRLISIFLTICFTINGLFSNFLLPLAEFSFTMPIIFFTGQTTEFDLKTQEEFEAFEFLKEYVQDDRLVFYSDCAALDDTDPDYFKISAFAELKNYFEGYLYAERNLAFENSQERKTERTNFFSDNLTSEEKYNFAVSKNIGYIFILQNDNCDSSAVVHPETGEFFEQIFANSTVTIYEIIIA